MFDRGRDPPKGTDVGAMLDFMHQIIGRHMPIETTTQYETEFLKIYFDFIKGDSFFKGETFCKYNALLPIPQMQLYVEDVLDFKWSFQPRNNFRVDFGFWTGTLVAVEIDGNEPEGYARDIRREGLCTTIRWLYIL